MSNNASVQAVIQNLEDAGCDPETVEEFLALDGEGKTGEQLKLLARQRRQLLDRVHRVVWDGRHLTCSIGVLPVRAGSTPEELYRDADRLLYAAKERGRDQFVIGTAETAAQNCTGNGV